MSILEDAGYRIPRPGWPGRRRAIAIAALQVVGMFIVAAAALVACSGAIVVAWAMRP